MRAKRVFQGEVGEGEGRFGGGVSGFEKGRKGREKVRKRTEGKQEDGDVPEQPLRVGRTIVRVESAVIEGRSDKVSRAGFIRLTRTVRLFGSQRANALNRIEDEGPQSEAWGERGRRQRKI